MHISEEEVVQKLLGTIDQLPDSHARLLAESHASDKGYDAQVESRIQGKSLTLFVEAKQHVYPRDVHQYIYNFREAMKRAQIHFDDSVVFLLAAQNISPGAKEILRNENCSYFDSGGSLYIHLRDFLIDRERPPAPSEARIIRSLFTGTRARVVLTMLVSPNNWMNVKQVSEEAAVSPATASAVLQTMEKNDWVAVEGSGPHKQRRVRRPREVLDAWAKFVETHKGPKQRRYYIPQLSSLDFTYTLPQLLDQHGIEYELTGEAAAQHYAPWLTNITILRVRMASSQKIEQVLAELKAKPTNEGSNLSVMEVDSPAGFVHRQNEEGIWYAHPIRVYLDLLKLEGRARDAAQHLRETKIGF